jgi:signal transduction histidine kinase
VSYELASNAVNHAARSPVAFDWSFESDMLFVAVHDSGTGLSHLLADRFLPLELIGPQLFRKGGGLSIVRRVAHSSGGLLLARRSTTLGGAEIGVRLPISAYSLEEVK